MLAERSQIGVGEKQQNVISFFISIFFLVDTRARDILEKKQMFCVSLQDMYALAGHSEEVCGEKPGSVCVLMCA